MYKPFLNKVNLFFEKKFWSGVHDDKYQHGDYGQQWKIECIVSKACMDKFWMIFNYWNLWNKDLFVEIK